MWLDQVGPRRPCEALDFMWDEMGVIAGMSTGEWHDVIKKDNSG